MCKGLWGRERGLKNYKSGKLLRAAKRSGGGGHTPPKDGTQPTMPREITTGKITEGKLRESAKGKKAYDLKKDTWAALNTPREAQGFMKEGVSD